MKYKYIINFFYEDCGYEIPINFYEEYPFDKVKKEIEKYGYFDFIGNDDIETVDFYINDYLIEVD